MDDLVDLTQFCHVILEVVFVDGVVLECRAVVIDGLPSPCAQSSPFFIGVNSCSLTSGGWLVGRGHLCGVG